MVTDALAHVTFLFEMEHRRVRLVAHENKETQLYFCYLLTCDSKPSSYLTFACRTEPCHDTAVSSMGELGISSLFSFDKYFLFFRKT